MHTSPAFFSQQSLGKRDSQQDAVGNLLVSSHHRLYILADGMGGYRGGEIAAQTVVKAFLEFFTTQVQSVENLEYELQQALIFANQCVATKLAEQPDLDGMGTTVVAVLLDSDTGKFAFVSVGDSPLYLWEVNKLRRINANHAFAADLQKMVEAGEMAAADAQNHPARYAITSAVCGKDIAKMDVHSGVLSQNASLLLASDGLNVLSEETIISILEKHSEPEPAVAALLAAVEAIDHPQQDNTSVILVSMPTEKEILDKSKLQSLKDNNKNYSDKPKRKAMSLWKSVLLGMLLGLIGFLLVYVLMGKREKPVIPSVQNQAVAPVFSASVPQLNR